MISKQAASFMIVIMYLSVFLALSFLSCRHALQMFQQNHYELYRYSKWLLNKNNLKVNKTLIFVIAVIILGIVLRKNSLLVILLLSLLFTIYSLYQENKKVYIKDLVVTARVKRQIVCLFLLMCFFILAFSVVFPYSIVAVLSVYSPYLMIYPMALLTMPLEYLIKKHYENQARDILDSMPFLIKIGITGSYGKTSTKNIVNDIISNNFYTLITPASYNTPMGITRTVREMLKPIHEVFVCEMGADKVGDISYLMDFVKPRYGIVTSIGPQHLATFHSQENITREKMQAIEMLPADGVGFINIDNEFIRDYPIQNSCRIVSIGIDNKEADYVAENIEFTNTGSSFDVKIDEETYRFTTVLLGRHNISNILLGIALARELGLSINDIVKNVKGINRIEHRLEVKKINGFNFIDDAFNANPVGSKRALDVLELMDGLRVIVTPGMIDLGADQDRLNREFGAYMKGKADYVILVGELQTRAILEGLRLSDFDEDKITVCSNVNEAFRHVYSHFSPKDTILLENDLPDAFNV